VYFYAEVVQVDFVASRDLCADPTNTFNFMYNSTNFQDYIKSSVALLSVFFFGKDFNVANANYYQTFAELTGWNDTEIYTYFRASNTGMNDLAWDLQQTVYNQYSKKFNIQYNGNQVQQRACNQNN
jgi:hypothetical protein